MLLKQEMGIEQHKKSIRETRMAFSCLLSPNRYPCSNHRNYDGEQYENSWLVVDFGVILEYYQNLLLQQSYDICHGPVYLLLLVLMFLILFVKLISILAMEEEPFKKKMKKK